MADFFRLILDTAAPTGISIKINNGAEFTSSPFVVLKTEINVISTAGYKIKIWGIDGFQSENEAVWDYFSKEKNIQLTNQNGEKTVYVRVMDDVGNVSDVFFDTIYLDSDESNIRPSMMRLRHSIPAERVFDHTVRVYDKNKNMIAIFNGESEGISEEGKIDLMVRPVVHIESNGSSTFSFQMLVSSQKWQDIKDPENLYHVNGRWYTALNDNAYQYTEESGVRIVNVTLVETWYLLDRKYNQAYNCGVYVYAKAKFSGWVNDGASFTIKSYDCSGPGGTITAENAWAQVKNWEIKDEKNNLLTYSILTSDDYKPEKWKDTPPGVHFKSFIVSGNTATVVVESLGKTTAKQTFEFQDSRSAYYYLKNQEGKDLRPIPSKIKSVSLNYTTTTKSGNKVTYKTQTSSISFSYSSSSGAFRLNYTRPDNVVVNGVIAEYEYNNLGNISSGATCTFAYGAEAVDEHTFIILPKSKEKYKLTVNGIEYQDNQVKDSRGAILPRGSGGYAMWAALKDSGWTLGVCDVIATGFNASEDYGCFNVESDMKDVLYNVQYVQQLYGGILDWDSENQIVNYRAENNTDYQAYNDGFNEWGGVEFREGKNMLGPPVITVDNKVITKAYILGYGNLNIAKVNGDKNYITNFSYTSDIYEGYLTQTLIFDTNDEGGQKQLLYWGKKELSKQCKPRKTISFSVQDMRDIENGAYSHEVFDINNVVRVVYHDDHDKKNTVEEQRVTMWEYNVFAMWDSRIEIGDKTKNLIDLFHLIYKSTLSPTGSNASGEISSSTVNVGGNTGDGDFSGMDGYGSNLEQYIQILARTTTENSDAIAGLILDTSETHSQVDLFAQYQKQTDTIFTQTYAGLQFYADEQAAQAIVTANNNTTQKIKEYDGTVTTRLSQTEASLKTYADSKVSSLAATVSGNYTYLNNKIGQLQIQTEAGFEAIQTEQGTLARQFASYQREINGELRSVNAEISSIATETEAQNRIIAQLDDNISGIIQTVDEKLSLIQLMSYANGSGGYVRVGSGWVTIYADQNNQYNGSIIVDTNSINIYQNTSGRVDIGEYVYIPYLFINTGLGRFYNFVPYSLSNMTNSPEDFYVLGAYK